MRCVDSIAKSKSFAYNSQIARWLPGYCGHQGVVRYHGGKSFKWGHTMMSLDGAEFQGVWFEAYNIQIFRLFTVCYSGALSAA